MKKGITQKVVAITLSMAMIAGMAVNSDPSVKAATIKLNRTKASIYVNGKFKLSVSGGAKKVKWSTSKKKVATVSKTGLVKGISKGTAKITAKVKSKKLVCKVTVKLKKAVEYTATKAPIVNTAAPIPTTAPVIPTSVPNTVAPTTTAVVTIAPTVAPKDTPEPTKVQNIWPTVHLYMKN